MIHQTFNGSSLQKFNLSDKETLSSQVLTTLQKQGIQNEIANIAEQLLNLVYNPQNPMEFVQNDAFLKGQKAFAQSLLDKSNATEELLNELAQQSLGV